MTHTMNVNALPRLIEARGGATCHESHVSSLPHCGAISESCQLVAPLRGNRCMHTPRGLVDAASVSRVYLSLTLPPLKGLRREPWPVPATPRVGCCKNHTGWFLCTHDVAHGRGGSRRRTDHCHIAKRDFRQTDDGHSVAKRMSTTTNTEVVFTDAHGSALKAALSAIRAVNQDLPCNATPRTETGPSIRMVLNACGFEPYEQHALIDMDGMNAVLAQLAFADKYATDEIACKAYGVPLTRFSTIKASRCV